ncbi:MAG: GNA1162 family protein [bacterium]
MTIDKSINNNMKLRKEEYLMNRLIKYLILLSISLAFLTGCGVTTRIYTRGSASIRKSACILQPESLNKDKDAGLKVREQLATELLVRHVFGNIVDLGVTDDAARKLKIRGTTELGKDTLKALGEELSVDSIIFGSIPEFGKDSKDREGRVEVSINLTMVDAHSGETLWKGYSSKVAKVTLSEIFGITAGPTPLEVSRDVVRDFVSNLKSELHDYSSDEDSFAYTSAPGEPIITGGGEVPPAGETTATEDMGTGEDGAPLPTMVPLRRKRR